MLNESSLKKCLRDCVIICFILALLSLGFVMLQDGGAFTVVDDFNSQQIPFTMALHNSLTDGGLGGWSWNMDLGTSTMASYGFSQCGSIFFYLSLLFPASAFPYVIGWIYMLKYVLAGMTAFLYISLFVKDRRYAVIGAVLYAFSGYQTVNLEFYCFHDVAAFFPLLLYSLERCMENRRDCPMFILAVFLNAVTNYFFFVQSVIFLVIYFVLRFWSWNPRVLFGRAVLCAGCGALGMAMGAVILLPCFVYLMGGTRAGADLFYIDALIYDTRRFLYIVKGIFLPAEPMNDQNSVYRAEWSSTSCWLPLVGMSLVFAYMRKNRNWLSRLLVVLIVISFSPLLTCGFLLFKGTYQRWWYCFVMIMALASAIVAENREDYEINFGTVANGIIILVFCGMLMFMRSYEEEFGLVFHRVRFLAYAAIAFFGVVYVYAYGKLPRIKLSWDKYLLLGICAAAVLSTAATLHFYRAKGMGGEAELNRYEIGQQLELPEQQYRLRSYDNRIIFSGDAIGTGAFSSTVTSSIVDFDLIFDYYNNIYRLDKGAVPGLYELLGAKYYISAEPGNDVIQTIETRLGTNYLHEAEACPIGFAADSYVLTDELMQVDWEKRAIAMLDSIALKPAGAAALGHILSEKTGDELELERSVSELTAENASRAVKNFRRDGKGFTCTTDYSDDSVVWFSVPYDSGWSAFVDGAETDIVYSGGMMAIAVPAGGHEIAFSYRSPGFDLGIAVSLASFAVFGLFCLVLYRRGKRN